MYGIGMESAHINSSSPVTVLFEDRHVFYWKWTEVEIKARLRLCFGVQEAF